jgi:anti-sigma-K factor RskA
MTSSHELEEWCDLLASYVLGDLTSEEVVMVNELLESHPELNHEVRCLEETLALLPLALPESSPSADLKAKILELAEAEKIELNVAEAIAIPQLPRRKLNLWAGLGSTIAATLVVGLGWWNHQLNQQIAQLNDKVGQYKQTNQQITRLNQELAQYQETIALLRQPNNRLVSLHGMGTTPKAAGSMVVVPKSQTVVLTIENLTPPPQGQVYRLWAMSGDKKINCGDFQPDAQGKVLVQLPIDNSMPVISAAKITIEPVKSLPQPTGATVMEGSSSI